MGKGLEMELTKEQIDLLKSMNAIFINGNTYGYFRLPWVKLTMGSNIGEFYVSEKDIPEELKKAGSYE